MGQSAKPTRQNRTITVDFQEPSTYLQLIHDGKAFVECVFAFLLSRGFQLTHKAAIPAYSLAVSLLAGDGMICKWFAPPCGSDTGQIVGKIDTLAR